MWGFDVRVGPGPVVPPRAALGWLLGWLLALVLALLASAASGRAAELVMPDAAREVATHGHLEAFFDPTGEMTEPQVRAPGIPFVALPGNFNASYTPRGAWWLRLKVKPEPGAAGPWWLEITAPYTDHIAAYVPTLAADGTRQVSRKETGMLVPALSRDLFTFTNVVGLTLAAEQPAELYLRLSGARALNAQITLWRLPELLRHLTVSVLVFSLGVGAAMITCIGALVMAVWLRSPVFGWYGAYVGSVSLVFLGNGGFGPVLFASSDPALISWLQYINGCFSVVAGAFMARAIFRPQDGARVADIIILLIGGFAAVCALITALGFYKLIAPPLMLAILTLALLSPWLAFRQLRTGEPAALFYFVGFSSYSAATIWFALVVLGLAPFTSFMNWGYQTVGLLHMVAIFAGLASAMRAGSRDRRRLEVQLLAASRRNAQQLEQAVTERTFALNEEIEARRRAEEALRKALREQRNFLAMVSHEFRTPLATMRLAIGVLERGVSEADSVLRREVAKVGRAVMRLSHLIDTFLAEEWLENTAMVLQRKTVDLGALAADVAREHAVHAPTRIFLGPCARTEIEGDAVLLRTVVDNLVANAVKHTGGEIFVSVEPGAGGAVLRVADQGEGVQPGEREEIFERFYRSSGAMTRPGAGIGLHLVRRIVELHGGHVGVTQAAEGGSLFEAWLPAGSPLDAAASGGR